MGGSTVIGQLTSGERQFGLFLTLLVGMAGAALGLAGRNDLLAYHGALIFLVGAGGAFYIFTRLDLPEPDPARLQNYYDDPIRVGIVLTMAWAVLGLFVGVWVAALLAWPELTFGTGWSSFGRVAWHLIVRMRRFGSSWAVKCENLGCRILKLSASAETLSTCELGLSYFRRHQ